MLMEKVDDAALVLTEPRQLDFEPVAHRPLKPDEVRLRTLYSGVSAGTELSQYRGTSPFMNRRWDAELTACSSTTRRRAGPFPSATSATRKWDGRGDRERRRSGCEPASKYSGHGATAPCTS